MSVTILQDTALVCSVNRHGYLSPSGCLARVNKSQYSITRIRPSNNPQTFYQPYIIQISQLSNNKLFQLTRSFNIFTVLSTLAFPILPSVKPELETKRLARLAWLRFSNLQHAISNNRNPRTQTNERTATGLGTGEAAAERANTKMAVIESLENCMTDCGMRYLEKRKRRITM